MINLSNFQQLFLPQQNKSSPLNWGFLKIYWIFTNDWTIHLWVKNHCAKRWIITAHPKPICKAKSKVLIGLIFSVNILKRSRPSKHFMPNSNYQNGELTRKTTSHQIVDIDILNQCCLTGEWLIIQAGDVNHVEPCTANHVSQLAWFDEFLIIVSLLGQNL